MTGHGPERRYLVIQTAFLGDVTLTLGLAEYIKRQDPGSRVVFLTTPQATPVASLCRFVDTVVIYDKRNRDAGWPGLFRLARRLRPYRFQAAFIPHRSLRSALLAFLAGIRPRYGFNRGLGQLLHTRRIRYHRHEHEVIRNLNLVRAHWNDGDRSFILPQLNIVPLKEDYITIAPGSVWATKRWPADKWAELLQHPYLRGQRFVMVGSRQDRPVADAIVKKLAGDHSRLEDRVGSDDLPQSFRIIADGKLLISNDSGPQHFAVALKTPVLTVFCSTVRDFGFYPAGKYDRTVETELNLDCRPCGIHGHKRCPRRTETCMRSISVEQVIRRLQDIEQDIALFDPALYRAWYGPSRRDRWYDQPALS